MVPGYDSVRQTVSEIGEVGSPAQGLLTVMLIAVAACLLVFAIFISSIPSLRNPAIDITAFAHVRYSIRAGTII